MAELDPLPDDIQALLARAQSGAPAPPPGAEAAVLAKVSATVGAPITGAALSAAWTKALAGVGALGVAALVTAGVLGAFDGDDAPRPVQGPVALMRPDAAVTPAPSLLAVEAPAVAASSNAASPIVDAPSIEAPKADAAEADAPRIDPRAVSLAPPSRAAEGALVEAAREALARGDADLAIAKLEEHQKKFGARGQLVEERHALTVVAFSQRGDAARAHSAAKAFLRLYPNSLFGDTVRAAAGAP